MLYLGVDLGGTNIKAALVNSEGEILCEANTPTNLPRPAEAVCDDIAALCLQLAEGKDVAGVGVGCPGTVDGGTVLYSNNLDWHDFAMRKRQVCRLPLVMMQMLLHWARLLRAALKAHRVRLSLLWVPALAQELYWTENC